MIAVNISTFRENLKTYLDRITVDQEICTITRKGEGNNIVAMPEELYNILIENGIQLSDPANVEWLRAAKEQLATMKVTYEK